MKAAVIINRNGGIIPATGAEELAKQVKRRFARTAVSADIRLVPPAQLRTAFENAAGAGGYDLLVAGGGDGTVSTAATVATRSGLTLGILPFGTLNHFARDAGIPTDLAKAVRVLTAGHSALIDVGEVNGHTFVNNCSVGLYREMLAARDGRREGRHRSKRLDILMASLRALHHFRRHRLTVRVAGDETTIRAPLLFVGNNCYQTSLLALGRRESLQEGALCLYALLTATRRQLVGFGLRSLLGRLDQQRDFISFPAVREAEVRSHQRTLALSADGEALWMRSPLHFAIRPQALRLLVPEKPSKRAAP
jgi:diacylglycerol kinase family enzyme